MTSPSGKTHTIRLLCQEDLSELAAFCTDHHTYQATQQSTDYSALNFSKLENYIKENGEEKKRELVSPTFGIYGYYLQTSEENPQLVGIIRMLGVVLDEPGLEGYAECEMTMHPNHRGKGLGYIFRKQFHEQIISPLLETPIKFQNIKNLTFHGTIGYIHANNMASRKLVTKLGFDPVKISCQPYLRGKQALQIMYIYPPRSTRFKEEIPHEVKTIILENDPHKNVDIVLTNLSQREMLLEFFGVLQSTTLQRGGIPEEYFEERIFIKLTKDFLTNFLDTASPDDVLLKLCQEVAFYNTSIKLLEEGFLTTLKDGPFQTFLKTQYTEKRQQLEKAMT